MKVPPKFPIVMPVMEPRPECEFVTNPDAAFQRCRVGAAVASRNIHAAIYDSLRLCKAF